MNALTQAVDAQIARLAGPPAAERPPRAGHSPIDAATREVVASLRQIRKDHEAATAVEAERQATLKAARERQAGERGRQLVREWEARQAALAATVASPPASAVTAPPAATQSTVGTTDASHSRQRRQALGAIFEAACNRSPNDSEVEQMLLPHTLTAEVVTASAASAHTSSLLAPYL